MNLESKSEKLADELKLAWEDKAEFEVDLLDLKEADLPPCFGGVAYEDDCVIAAKEKVEAAGAIFFASPIYVYNFSAAMKNFVELTGHSMKGKVTGFLCANRGRMGYMSVISLANSLMLDFRMFVLPRFVYVAAEDWEGNALEDEIKVRIGEFATSF